MPRLCDCNTTRDYRHPVNLRVTSGGLVKNPGYLLLGLYCLTTCSLTTEAMSSCTVCIRSFLHRYWAQFSPALFHFPVARRNSINLKATWWQSGESSGTWAPGFAPFDGDRTETITSSRRRLQPCKFTILRELE